MEVRPMSRSSQLLKAAADALENGEDPLALHFLSEYDVEAGECLDLADSLALGARLIAWAMENPKKAVVAVQGAVTHLEMDAVTRLLGKLNKAA
jgi:hypothetical protein